jgi:hypothetical protein
MHFDSYVLDTKCIIYKKYHFASVFFEVNFGVIPMARLYKDQPLKQVLLRIPEEMRSALEKSAEAHGRSLTAEVIARLETTFGGNEPWLSKIQSSPQIQIEKKLLATEVKLELLIDDLTERVAALEKAKRD